MTISTRDVSYVAELANLEVPEEEQEALASQLSRIVDYIAHLDMLDTETVPPTAQVVAGESPVMREDRVEPRTGSSEAGRSVGFFRVPKVITER